MAAILNFFYQKIFPTNNTQLQLEKTQKNQAKFVKLGFPQELCQTHSDCVDFLMTSGLAFTIDMFKNSTRMGPQEHGVRLSDDKHPLIKMNGQWQRWDVIKNLVEYDEQSYRIVSKGDSSIGWNYISPDGLVQKDIYTYDRAYPVEVLAHDEHVSLQNHAKKFWDTHPEIDPGQEKKCVIQIVSTERNPVSRSWLTENFLDNMAEHSYIRMIDEEGKVYSFGAVMPKDELAVFKSALPFTLASTINANAGMIDYDETRPFDARRVTSIPMTSARKEAILDYVSEINKDGIRFNMARQSCLKFATAILEMGGVSVPTRITFGELLSSMMPSFSKLPGISHMVTAAAKAQEAAQPIFERMMKYIPQPIKTAVSFIGEKLSYVAKKVGTILSNTVALALGGWCMSAPLPPHKQHQSKLDDKKLTDFHRLIYTFSDFFDDETSDNFHSMKLKAWQREQASTIIYKDEGPKMYMLPVLS